MSCPLWISDITSSNIGIKCEECEHVLWCSSTEDECVKNTLDNMISEYISYKKHPFCYNCKCNISFDSLADKMNKEQLQNYRKEILQWSVHKCNSCSTEKICEKDCQCNFLYCENKECNKASCTVCHEEFKVVPDNHEMEKDEYLAYVSNEGMKKHLKCLFYKVLKDEWEAAIYEGETRQCPGCKQRVVKDLACTHMTWNNSDCKTEWCYVCERAF